MGNLNGEHKI